MFRAILLTLPLMILMFSANAFTASARDAQSCTVPECHAGIEDTSENHKLACTECHEGNPNTKDKDAAHKDMLGGRNPSDPSVWDKGCGKCHQYQHDRVNTTLMYTNAGMIKNAQQAWDDYKGQHYSTAGSKGVDAEGNPVEFPSVSELEELSGELYRKFCSTCHVGFDKLIGYRSHHSSGCSACHFSHSVDGAYAGGDKTIQGKKPYPEKHIINPLPEDDVCLTCHNRSGRIALSYRGEYDGNNSLVPTNGGIPGPELMDGIRSIRHMQADIHKEYGMDCIDCHTSRDMMGDGYLYENMFQQLEVTCEDCHGTENELPKTAKITKESDSPLRESRHYAVKANFGDEMVLTSKGRMYSNVKKEGDKFVLYTKRNGKRLEIKTVTDTADHMVYGHERMECYTCHSKTVVQCYGCHTTYDKSQTMMDWVKMEETKGLFSEKEDFRSFFPFPMGINQKGKIAPVTPGCQTFLTVLDENENVVLKEHIFNYKGGKKFKFAPFFGHNTGKKAITCRKCHADLMFAGFGQGLVSVTKKNIDSSYMCEQCDKPLDSLYTLKNGRMSVTSDIVRDKSRVFTPDEISRIFDANRCIICHDKGDKKIYGKKIDYEKILSDSVHKPLLAD
jgi:hypothetical protein